MSTVLNRQVSPQIYARIGGLLYLVNIAAGLLGEIFVRGKIVVPGNAATTAANIQAHETLWRIGIAGDLVMHITDVPMMLIMYVLLRPVNKNLALMVVLFDVVQTSVLVANKLNLLTALSLTGIAGNDQLVYLFAQLHEQGFGVGLIFFSFDLLISGYLIRKSGYFPKVLGILLQIAGMCYLTNSFSAIVDPKFADHLFPFVLIPCFIAELSFCLWLLVKGVNMAKWEERKQLSPGAFV